jgi:hypothetical protein
MSKAEAKTAEVGLDADDGDEMVTLISKSGDKFQVNKSHAQIAVLVKTTLDGDTSTSEVNIPGVATPVLEKVVEYMKYHKGEEPPIIPKPLRSKEMKVVCSDANDAAYIDKIAEDRQKLYDLILAANYMDIKSLLHLGCAKVASLIKGQPLEKIKDILQPKPDGGDKAKA